MKYVFSLIVGLLCGFALFVAGYYYNPFVGHGSISPLAVSDVKVSNVSYSTVTTDTILFTNDGESLSQPYPDDVAELWEPTIRDTQVMVTSLLNSRGMPAGIGIKISSPSEKSSLFNTEALVNSVWHLYIPGRGTLAIDQTENYWSYIRDLVIPAWRDSGGSWRGSWSRNTTTGPGALGSARVTGLGGEFDGLQSEAVESVNARAYSAVEGPVSMTGMLSIAIADESIPGGQ